MIVTQWDTYKSVVGTIAFAVGPIILSGLLAFISLWFWLICIVSLFSPVIGLTVSNTGSTIPDRLHMGKRCTYKLIDKTLFVKLPFAFVKTDHDFGYKTINEEEFMAQFLEKKSEYRHSLLKGGFVA